MYFEGRDLKPYAEPISAGELEVGTVYFAVGFADQETLFPIMIPKVYIGQNLDNERSGHFHFQDINSYRRGVRFESATDDDEAEFEESTSIGDIFEYEKALDILLTCALRRKKICGPR